MSKKPSRKKLLLKVNSYQKQYDLHQEKLTQNPKSPAIAHWKKEKETFLGRINYYLNKIKSRKT